MLSRQISANVGLLLLSTVISLVVTEVCLRAMTPPEYFLDQRTDLFWKTIHHRSSIHQTRKETDTVPDPELGWRMKPYYESVGVHHNSHGFRASHEYTQKPTKSRIFVIGDSMTYGLGVPDNSTFPAYLEQITGIETINAGVNAYGADQALRMWEAEGAQLHPTHVILGYTVDDFFRNELSFRDAAKPRYIFDQASQQFILKPITGNDTNSPETSSIASFASSFRALQAIGWLARRIKLKLGFVDEEWMTRAAQTSEHILKRLQSSATRSGAKLLVVVIGYHKDKRPHEYLWAEKSIMEACRSNGIECLNLAAATREVDQGLIYGPNGHYSKEGNLFAAQKIATFLRFEKNEANF